MLEQEEKILEESENVVEPLEEEESKKFSAGNFGATFLGRVGDILILHFAFLICSLPLITIGASLSAAIYTGMKLAAGKEGYVLSNFFKGFKDNFKRSTLYWIIALLTGAGIWFSYGYWSAFGGTIGMMFSIIVIVLAFVWTMTMLYLFGVQAKFYNTIRATIKNAFLMSVRHFHITLLMVIILVVFVYLAVNFMPLQAIAAVSGAGILSIVFGKLYNIVFSSYE